MDVQFSALQVFCPEVDSEAKDIENCLYTAADLEKIETIFSIIVSANQLSLYGAIAEMCEEYESLHERTGRPVVMGQSIVLSAIKTRSTFGYISIAARWRTNLKAIITRQIEQILYGRRISECC